jgi:TonB family protein
LPGFIWRWNEIRAKTLVVITIAAGLLFAAPAAYAQGELTRKAKTKVAPVYPQLARRANMNITGTVRILVVVAPNGSIKESKVLGGHPLLVGAALDALKKWKFEPASEETTGTVEFKFEPQ